MNKDDIFIDVNPEGWSLARIEQFANVVMGQSPPSESYNTSGIGQPFFQGKAEFGSMHPTVQKWCTSATKFAREGNILISVRAPVGAVNIADRYCAIGRGLAAVDYKLCNKFLYYYFILVQRKLDEKGTGTTFRAISADVIRTNYVSLPPLAEQHRIVAKIEELFSSLDKGVETLKTAQQQLKVYRQAVLKWAFEGRLTQPDLKEGELPEGWVEKSLGDLVKTIDGDRGHNYPKKEEYYSQGYCLFLSTKNVREGSFLFEENIFISKQKDELLRGGKLQLGDVVITTRGTLGNVALYDAKVPFKHVRINSGMLILRITSPDLLNYYLMKYISSPLFSEQLKRMQSGTAQPQIPANVLREIKIPYSNNLLEQEKIVQEIESRLSVCDKIEESIEQGLQQAEALRQSILKKAFEGKLVPQDPNDEPASVLLERIKAERASGKSAMKESVRKGRMQKA